MNLAPGGLQLSFEVTFDSDTLHVGMSVYDTTTSSPNLVQGPTAMVNVLAGTYVGKFIPTTGRSYVIVKAVYTDSGLTILSPDYSQGSESIIAQDIGGGGSGPTGGAVIGYVNNNNTVVGLVNC